MVRGTIDGISLSRGCWITAVEGLVAVEKDIRRLNAYHDVSGPVGAGVQQVAGGVVRTAGVTKAINFVSGMFGKGDRLPSVDSIEKGLSSAKGKIDHLFCLLNHACR